MSSAANFPNPCLVAILLVCNTRNGSGAQLLFHYPPNPLSDDHDQLKVHSAAEDSDDETSSDSDTSLTDEDDLFAAPNAQNLPTSASRRVTVNKDTKPSSRSNSFDRDGRGSSATRPLLGLGEDGLVSLLTPDRIWHKRRFELGINDLTFVGRPTFVRHDGSWVKRRRARPRMPKVEDSASDTVTASEDEAGSTPALAGDVVKDTSLTQPVKNALTMFHIVFVMNPPPLEHTSRVKDMYDHVIKKFSRALKLEQVQNDYVWRQTELMLSVRSADTSKHLTKSQLSAEILDKSSLASTISTVYNAISNSRIASVTLGPRVSVSLQIPPITFTSYLPSLTEPPIQPGLWLTTATDLGSVTSESDGTSAPDATEVAKHYTLLLKSAPHRIAKDAQDAGGPLAHILPKFLSALRPTKSFYKLQLATQMSARDIRVLAHHLIYWRRAVAIPPLYQGDTYIVSPNADLRKLSDATKAYEREFPLTMPSLPKMLSILSGIPRPYRSLIPHNDHKEIYFLALAWLMRHGWVTQLRTFAYVRVNPSIKKAVRSMERESRSRPANSQAVTGSDEEVKDMAKTKMKRPSMVSHASSDRRRSLEGFQSTRNDKVSSLVLNPPRASPIESRWLDYIGDSLTDEDVIDLQLSPEDREEISRFWPVAVKYFSGSVALQTIPVREGRKRKVIWALLDKLGVNQKGGVEDANGRNQRILVTVQHW